MDFASWRSRAGLFSFARIGLAKRTRKSLKGLYRPRLVILEDRTLLATSITVGPTVNVSNIPGNQSECTLSINPTNPNNIIAFSNDFGATNGGIQEYVSNDGGTTWSHKLIGANDGLAINACCDGQSAFDQFGNYYLTFIDFTGGSSDAIKVIRSSDGGATFTPITILADTNGGLDQPSIATGAGMVWVDWTNIGLNSVQAVGASVSGLGAVGAFGTIENVPGSANGSFGDIAISPSGAVTLTYQSPVSTAGPSNVLVNIDPDGLGPQGFGQAITATATNVGGFRLIPAQNSTVGIDAEANLAYDFSNGPHHGRLYMVLTDAPSPTSNSTAIFELHSDDNGATWSAEVRVDDNNTGNSVFFPQFGVDPTTGNLAVAWYDARNAGAANNTVQVFGAVSFDGGDTFTPSFQISAGTSNSNLISNGSNSGGGQGFGDYNKADFFNGVFHPVWADNSPNLPNNPDPPNLEVATAAVNIGSVTPPPPQAQLFAVGAGVGGGPQVNVYNADGSLKFAIMAYDPRFTGGVRVATADLNGDGIPDIITAPGPGGGPDIRVFDGQTGALIQEFMAYDPRFTGGVFVAAGDINGDGVRDIITGAGFGGGPEVRVFSGRNDVPILSFFAFDPRFLGGVQVASGDVNGDGRADIVAAAGPSGGPHVRVFSGINGRQLAGPIGSFFAYNVGFRGGVNVAVGDVNGDGRADIITGPGFGGGPNIRVFSGATGGLLRNFLTGPAGSLFGNDLPTAHSGLFVASADVNGDGRADIIVGNGPGAQPIVQVFDANSLALIDSFFAFDQSFRGGVFVGGV
jgi:hypothetical protein